MLTVRDNILYKDNGRPFFYLADTCWSAFTSIEIPDWKYYLDYRKSEGFNVIQINILRQWDSSLPLPGKEPFAIKEKSDGSYEYDFSKINESYFDNAVKMLTEMKKRNMIPALVLLWGNYVPDTWMAPYVKNNVMPFEQIKQYITYVVNKFKQFNPIYFVSGDVGFTDNGKQKAEMAAKYYREVLHVAKSVDPDGLYTFHINGESTAVPKDLFDESSFFSYQSGHGEGQQTAYTIPQEMLKNGCKKPMIDTELCYEGLTKMKSPVPERYLAYDVRKAAWRAVLSGANAGLGYGTFGIWPWKDTARPEQKLEANFNVQLVPYDWRDCLKFRGAKDLGFLKNIIEKYQFENLKPISKPNKDDITIRAAQNDKYLLIYLPTAGMFDFNNLGIQVKNCKVVDLNNKVLLDGNIIDNTLQLLPVIEDELIIVNK